MLVCFFYLVLVQVEGAERLDEGLDGSVVERAERVAAGLPVGPRSSSLGELGFPLFVR
jgi:hypothetical protein